MVHQWSNDGGIHELPIPDIAGRLWLCSKYHIAPDVGAVLRAHDANTVVCLTRREELADRFPHYVDWLDLHAGTSAVWFPIPDLSAPPLHETRAVLDLLVQRLRTGDRVVMHCAAGIGRTGTMAVGILLLLGMPLDDALVHVRTHRPMAGPEVGSQRRLVEELQRELTADAG